MKLVKYNNQVLSEPCKDFDFSNPPFDPIEFAKELMKYTIDLDAVGVAANQIGIPYRIFSFRGYPQNFVVFNPRIISTSSETDIVTESCLSYPGLRIPVERPIHIRTRYNLPNSEVRTEKYTGATARVFQHEMKHLDGEVFFNKLISRLKLERCIADAKKDFSIDYTGIGLLKFTN
jgi:peptide deformylase